MTTPQADNLEAAVTTMTENSPVCLSDLGSSAARIPTAPLDDPWAELEALYAAASPGPWEAGHHPARISSGAIIRPVTFSGRVTVLPEWEGGHVLIAEQDAAFIEAVHAAFPKLIEAARQPSVGMEGAARNEQSPEPVKDQAEQGVEAVAWRVGATGFTDSRWVSEKAHLCGMPVEPLYSQATVSALQKREAGLREALRDIALLPDLSRNPADQFDRGARAARRDAARIAEAALGDQT